MRSPSWIDEETPSFAKTGEVDAIDGFVMAVSPWAVRNLRFDESLGKIHGYDFDFCAQARAAGHKVVTADLAKEKDAIDRFGKQLDTMVANDLLLELVGALRAKYGVSVDEGVFVSAFRPQQQ